MGQRQSFKGRFAVDCWGAADPYLAGSQGMEHGSQMYEMWGNEGPGTRKHRMRQGRANFREGRHEGFSKEDGKQDQGSMQGGRV